MKKVKVLFVSNSGAGSGATKGLLDILRHVNPQRYEAYLACPAKGPLQADAKKLGIQTFDCPWGSWLKYRLLSTMGRASVRQTILGMVRVLVLIKRLKIDIVYSNNGHVLFGAVASQLTRTPHVWHIQEVVSHRAFPYKIIDLLSSRVIVNSEFIKGTLPVYLRQRATVVYYGFCIDAEPLDSQARLVLRRRYDIHGDVVISLVGSIQERKGQKELLCAMPLIRERCPRAELLIVGDTSGGQAASYEREVRDVVRTHHLEDVVKFVGYQQDMSDIYQLTDILIVPSRQEPYGRVVVEALLWGIPVIATREGGIPEAIGDSQAVIWINSRDPEQIARAIQQMMGALEEMKRRAQTSRAVVAQRFRMGSMIEEIEDIISAAVQT